MNSFVNNLPNYGLSLHPYEIHTQKKPEVNNEYVESVPGNYRDLIKDIIQELYPLKTASNESNIDKVLKKHGFNLDVSNIRDDKVQNLIRNLQGLRFQQPDEEDSLKKNNKLLDDMTEAFKSIRNEIRNQALQRKSASEKFTASTSILEKEFAVAGELTTSTSYAEMWLRLAVFIGEVKADYVDFYANLMQKYTEMYESFNKNVQKASSDAVSTGDDGNNISFDKNKMQDGYNAFQKDVDRLNQELGSVNGWDNMSEDQKNSMTITLEPAYKVDSNGKISFNMDQYNSVHNTSPAGIKDGKVSTASYQAWLATFNSAGNTFQSNMQSFAQRYTQANNNFDTLNKILSSAISTLAESARDVLKSLS